jgi:hypothetical protein
LNQKSQPIADKTLNESQQNQKVHNPVHLLTIYPDLSQVVERWPELSEHIRTAIKALVESAGRK